jgi:Uma2 family endonuclease
MSLPLVTRSFTVDEYHRMAEAGILREDDRVELLDGQIVEMSPIGPGHAACVRQLARLLHDRAGHAILVAVQDPVVLGRHWEPQLDLAALRPRPDAYRPRSSRCTFAAEAAARQQPLTRPRTASSLVAAEPRVYPRTPRGAGSPSQ